MTKEMPLRQSAIAGMLASGVMLWLLAGLIWFKFIGVGLPSMGWIWPIHRDADTTIAQRAGLFERMAVNGITRIQREGPVLSVTLTDGTLMATNVCLRNSHPDVYSLRRCGSIAAHRFGRGRAYELRADDGLSPSYRGDPHEDGAPVDAVLSWLRSDVRLAEELVSRSRMSRSKGDDTEASWKKPQLGSGNTRITP